MNEDLTFGILGAAMGVAAPHLGDVSGWLSAIGSVRKYRQGKISAEEAQRRLNHLNEEDKDDDESD